MCSVQLFMVAVEEGRRPEKGSCCRSPPTEFGPFIGSAIDTKLSGAVTNQLQPGVRPPHARRAMVSRDFQCGHLPRYFANLRSSGITYYVAVCALATVLGD